jgi:hypothetical protein
MKTTCTLTETHCENCGETSAEYIGYEALRENDGYSGCCNELVAYVGTNVYGRPETSCRGHHLEGA